MNVKEMAVWIIGIVLGASVLLSPAACTMNRHRLVAEAIEKGADPTAVKCAMESDVGHTPQCVLATAIRPQAAKQ